MSAAVLDTLPRHTPPDPRQMRRCLLLAALLHVWLVLVFGNATGSAAPGQGVWGSLTVKLTGHTGGSPGATPGEVASAENRATARPAPQADARGEGPAGTEPSTATLKLPDGFHPVERERLAPLTPRSSADIAALPTPVPVNRLEAQPDTRAAPLPSPAELRMAAPGTSTAAVPAALPPPVRRLEQPATAVAPTLPRAAELRPATDAAAVTLPGTDLPAPVRRLEAPENPRAATTPLPRAAALRPAPATPAVTDATTADLPAPVRRLENTGAERGAAPSLPRAADLRPAPGATASTAPDADLPAPVRRLQAADSASAPDTLQPASSMRAAQPSAASQSIPDLSRALPGAVDPPAIAGAAQGTPAADRFAAPWPGSGSPDAGASLGPGVPAPPTAPPTAAASAPPAPLNLSLPRGDMTSRRGPGLVELLPPPPERKSKLEQSIEDATNKDCRKAYANAGILAAVPLAVDAVRGKGCKW